MSSAFTGDVAANKEPASRAGSLLTGVPTGIVRRIPAPHPALKRGAAAAARRRVDSLPANRSNPCGVLIPEEIGGANKKPATRAGLLLAGVPTGIRTPVLTVKGWCPRPLDDGDEHHENVQQQKFGGARRDRTVDLLHAMQALSQLSYGPESRREIIHVPALKSSYWNINISTCLAMCPNPLKTPLRAASRLSGNSASVMMRTSSSRT